MFDHQRLTQHSAAVKDAQKAYAEAVAEEFPEGAIVEFRHGDRWIGPARVLGHNTRFYWSGPGAIRVENLRTGKKRWIHCSYVRPEGR